MLGAYLAFARGDFRRAVEPTDMADFPERLKDRRRAQRLPRRRGFTATRSSVKPAAFWRCHRSVSNAARFFCRYDRSPAIAPVVLSDGHRGATGRDSARRCARTSSSRSAARRRSSGRATLTSDSHRHDSRAPTAATCATRPPDPGGRVPRLRVPIMRPFIPTRRSTASIQAGPKFSGSVWTAPRSTTPRFAAGDVITGMFSFSAEGVAGAFDLKSVRDDRSTCSAVIAVTGRSGKPGFQKVAVRMSLAGTSPAAPRSTARVCARGSIVAAVFQIARCSWRRSKFKPSAFATCGVGIRTPIGGRPRNRHRSSSNGVPGPRNSIDAAACRQARVVDHRPRVRWHGGGKPAQPAGGPCRSRGADPTAVSIHCQRHRSVERQRQRGCAARRSSDAPFLCAELQPAHSIGGATRARFLSSQDRSPRAPTVELCCGRRTKSGVQVAAQIGEVTPGARGASRRKPIRSISNSAERHDRQGALARRADAGASFALDVERRAFGTVALRAAAPTVRQSSH